MMLLKVFGCLPNLVANGELVAFMEFLAECLGDLGVLCDVIACFYGIGNNLKLVFSSVRLERISMIHLST